MARLGQREAGMPNRSTGNKRRHLNREESLAFCMALLIATSFNGGDILSEQRPFVQGWQLKIHIAKLHSPQSKSADIEQC